MIKKTGLQVLLLMAMSINFVFAQSIEQYIPRDAVVVMKVDPARIAAKVDINELQNAEFFDAMLRNMSADMQGDASSAMYKAMKDPSSYGMDFNKPYYMYATREDNRSMFSFIFELNDASKFATFLNGQFKENEDMAFEESKKFSSYSNDNMGLTWSNNVGQMTGVMLDQDTTITLEEHEIASSNYLKKSLKKVNEKKSGASIQSQANYKISMVNSHDATFWMNYEKVQEWTKAMGGEDQSMAALGLGAFEEKMSALNKDSYMVIGTNFENGKMDMDTKMYMNPDMADLYKKSSGGGVNKKFAKYIPKNDLLGFYSMGLDINGMVGAMKKIIDPDNAMAPMMEGMAEGAMQGMGIDMTADDVYKMLKGDMVFAVSGIKEFKGVVKKTDYDEEFNPIEIEKEVTEKLPVVTMLMSYNNESDLKQVMNLAKDYVGLENLGGHYKMEMPGSPVAMYMGMHDGVMVVTNDKELVTKRLKKGLKRSKRMSKELCQMVTQKSLAGFWDVDATLDVANEFGMGEMGMDGMIRSSKETFNNMVITMDKVTSNILDSKMTINFDDKKKNSLTQFFNFINEMYLTEGQSL